MDNKVTWDTTEAVSYSRVDIFRSIGNKPFNYGRMYRPIATVEYDKGMYVDDNINPTTEIYHYIVVPEGEFDYIDEDDPYGRGGDYILPIIVDLSEYNVVFRGGVYPKPSRGKAPTSKDFSSYNPLFHYNIGSRTQPPVVMDFSNYNVVFNGRVYVKDTDDDLSPTSSDYSSYNPLFHYSVGQRYRPPVIVDFSNYNVVFNGTVTDKKERSGMPSLVDYSKYNPLFG